jgi:hypothetical protein
MGDLGTVSQQSMNVPASKPAMEMISQLFSSIRYALRTGGLAAIVLLPLFSDTRAAAQSLTNGIVTTQHQYVCEGDLHPLGEIVLVHSVPFCEKVDACGPPQWPEMDVTVGPPAQAIFIVFENLPPEGRKSLAIKGNGKWDSGARLRLGAGETTISGIRPETNGRWPSFSASEVLRSSRLAVAAGPARKSGALSLARVGEQPVQPGTFEGR